MAKSRVRFVEGAPGTVNPDQYLAGLFHIQGEGANETNSKKEKHKNVSSQEALEAFQSTKGRVVMAVYGISKSYPRNNPEGQLSWASSVVNAYQRKFAEQQLQENIQALKDYRVEIEAKNRIGKGRGHKFTRGELQVMNNRTREYDQKLMNDFMNRWTQFGYSRTMALSFAESPLPRRKKK